MDYPSPKPSNLGNREPRRADWSRKRVKQAQAQEGAPLPAARTVGYETGRAGESPYPLPPFPMLQINARPVSYSPTAR